jgi:O-antigen biosynthesis protein WbqV
MKFLTRKSLIVLHDLFMTAAAIVAAFLFAVRGARPRGALQSLIWYVPGMVIYAGFVYSFFHLDDAKWRIASLPDLSNIFPARSA